MRLATRGILKATRGLAIFSLAGLSGCTNILSMENPIDSSYDENIPLESSPGGVIKAHSKTLEGIRSMEQGRYQEAIRILSHAIRLDPQNGYLHYLNALAHTFLGRMKPAAYSNAEVGFQVALRLDPGNSWAAYNFGQLYMLLGNYTKAQDQFANSLLSSPKNTTFLLAFAVASYLVQDVVSALQSIQELETLGVQSPEFYRTAAIVYAASGDQNKAKENLRRFEKTHPSAEIMVYLKERIASWEQFFRLVPRADLEALSGQPKQTLATMALPGIKPESSGATKEKSHHTDKDNHKKASTSKKDLSPTTTPSSRASSDEEEAGRKSGEPVVHIATVALDQEDASQSAEELVHNMVVLDVLIVRTEMIRDASLGQDILSSLGPLAPYGGNPMWGYTFGRAGAFSSPSNGVVASPNSVVTQSLGLSNVSYSLDIANNSHSHSDIVATPSLVATHGKQSKFFSGTAVTLALTSTQGGGNLVTHEVGVTLTLTPTFLPDGRISLDVSAERSEFSDAALPGNVAVSSVTTPVMQTVTSSVTATGVLGKGESMVVSGLKEEIKVNSRNGTPGLEDVPVVSFFFSNEAIQRVERSVVFIISPRFNEKVIKDAHGNWIVLPSEENKNAQQYVSLLKRDFTHIFQPSLEKLFLKGLAQPQFLRQFRPKDMPIKVEETINLTQTMAAIKGEI